jgi:hypothetical protein
MSKKLRIFKDTPVNQSGIEALAGCVKGVTKGFCQEWFSDLVEGVTDTLVENNRKHNTIGKLFEKKGGEDDGFETPKSECRNFNDWSKEPRKKRKKFRK